MSKTNQTQDFTLEQFKKIETGEIKAQDFIQSNDFDSSSTDAYTQALEAKILEGESNARFTGKNQYKEQFTRALYQELGITRPAEAKIEVLNKEEREQFANQTVLSTASSGVPVGGIIATNINPLLDDLFYDNSIINEITTFADGKDKENVTDITNERTGQTGDEQDTGTANTNSTIEYTLNPLQTRIFDTMTQTLLLQEIENPTQSAIEIAKMVRACMNQAEVLVFGDKMTSPIIGAKGVFYPVLNAFASSGSNRGALSVTFVTTAGTRPTNHIDAINYVVGQLPIYSKSDAMKYKVYMNFKTFVKLTRVVDGMGRYYYDSASNSFPSLLCDPRIRIVNTGTIADDDFVVGDFTKVVGKRLRGLKIQQRVVSNAVREVWVDTYMDATLRFAYKATATKNAFRYATLKVDYTV
jgi:hypothetical protein